jgi:catechol 2,3-dioxygenase-like lactoylglutathione lyase family enzyme
MIRVTEMDHIVLRVSDIERSLAFYADTLGLAPERVDLWRGGEVAFPSVRVNAGTIIDILHAGANSVSAAPGANLDHFCLVVDAARIEDVAAHLQAAGVQVLSGPALRSGARGDGMSIYLHDPDGNLLELRTYAPQPRELAPSTTRRRP